MDEQIKGSQRLSRMTRPDRGHEKNEVVRGVVGYARGALADDLGGF